MNTKSTLDVHPGGDNSYPRLPLFDPERLDRSDPYAVFRRYRSQDPVHRGRGGAEGRWYLFRYRDVELVLKDPRFGRSAVPDPALVPRVIRPFVDMMSDALLLKNPPDHTRLRSLVNRAFTPRVAEQMRPRVALLSDELLDLVQEQGSMDLIADFAFLLPITVIATLLGVPLQDKDLIKRWSRALVAAVDMKPKMEDVIRASQAAVDFAAYLKDIFAERRRCPQDDLISAFVSDEHRGGTGHLSEQELIHNCMFLLIAGHETTVNLIGSGVFGLLSHRNQWERLLQDPSAVPKAIEELLRYVTPVQVAQRCAKESVHLGGRTIEQGDEVVLMLGAANHDPERWSEPDQLDVTRNVGMHAAFSFGIHFCAGAGLARVEAQVALAALLRRMPDLTLVTKEPVWRDDFSVRGLTALPVRFHAKRKAAR